LQVTLLKAKLHRARVTAADVNYEGSIAIDTDFIRLAGLVPYEKVLVADVENGERFETYVIPAEAGSRTIMVNGAAARMVGIGDHVIVMAFIQMESNEAGDWEPNVVLFDEDNQAVLKP
jgi:aspartate 1-decarboxylase